MILRRIINFKTLPFNQQIYPIESKHTAHCFIVQSTCVSSVIHPLWKLRFWHYTRLQSCSIHTQRNSTTQRNFIIFTFDNDLNHDILRDLFIYHSTVNNVITVTVGKEGPSSSLTLWAYCFKRRLYCHLKAWVESSALSCQTCAWFIMELSYWCKLT